MSVARSEPPRAPRPSFTREAEEGYGNAFGVSRKGRPWLIVAAVASVIGVGLGVRALLSPSTPADTSSSVAASALPVPSVNSSFDAVVAPSLPTAAVGSGVAASPSVSNVAEIAHGAAPAVHVHATKPATSAASSAKKPHPKAPSHK